MDGVRQTRRQPQRRPGCDAKAAEAALATALCFLGSSHGEAVLSCAKIALFENIRARLVELSAGRASPAAGSLAAPTTGAAFSATRSACFLITRRAGCLPLSHFTAHYHRVAEKHPAEVQPHHPVVVACVLPPPGVPATCSTPTHQFASCAGISPGK